MGEPSTDRYGVQPIYQSQPVGDQVSPNVNRSSDSSKGANPIDAKADDLSVGEYHDTYDDWVLMGTNIAMAGGAYPLLLCALMLVWNVVSGLYYVLIGDGVEILVGFLAIPVFAIFAAMVGTCYAGFVTLPVLLTVSLALRALVWRPRWDYLGVFCGGLVAYLCTLPLSLLGAQEAIARRTLPFLPVLLGPGLAIFCGQIGGAMAGLEICRTRNTLEDHVRQNGKLRYSLWQMMIVTAIVGGLLTLLRSTGLLTVPMLVASLMWLALHWIGREPAIWVGRKLKRIDYTRTTNVEPN